MTTRITVGPFNRVEGDLELRLDVENGVVQSAEVTAPLYRGFEQILLGRPALDALTLAPRICGICSVSQSMAVVAALRAASALEAAPSGVLAANLAHAAENAADHLTHFYVFFMPDFARQSYADRSWYADAAERFAAGRGSASGEALPARARLLGIMGVIAGKWPHSLAFQPGGTTTRIDFGARVRLQSIVADFRRFLEETLFDDVLESVLALDSAAALESWLEGRGGDFASFLRIAAAESLHRLGRGRVALMSFGGYSDGMGAFAFAPGIYDPQTKTMSAELALDRIREDVSHAWMRGPAAHPREADTIPDADRVGAYSWCKAPRLDGRPIEVGAVARQTIAGNRLVSELVARDGTNVLSRVVARLIELAALVPLMEQWLGAVSPQARFCFDTPLSNVGVGAGLVEAARGSLGHWLELRDGKIHRYQIIAPTSWNFSPRDDGNQPGPLEQALAGTLVGAEGARSVAVQHIVRSFDPCMVCTAH